MTKLSKNIAIITEDALIHSEIRYRRLFESAKDGILILDAKTGKIVDVNPFLIDLLGYTKMSLLKNQFGKLELFRIYMRIRRSFRNCNSRNMSDMTTCLL